MTTSLAGAPAAVRIRPRPARVVVLAGVFACAACGLVYELALVTLGSYLMGSSVAQTAIVLSVVMCAMGVGALAAKPLSRRAITSFAGVELTLALIGGIAVPALYAAFAWLNLYTLAMLLFTVAIGALIGAEIPLLMALVQTVRAQEASDAVADLSAADYVGALVGGLAFPFILLPTAGLLRGTVAVAGINVIAAYAVAGWLFAPQLPRRARAAVAGGSLAVAACLVLVAATASSFEVTARQALYEDPIVHSERSAYAEIVLTAGRLSRGAEPDVRLFLNGDLQFSSVDEYRYHEALVHPAMTGGRRRVAILGGGDGLAAREVLRYPDVESVTLVDLAPAVVRLARTNAAIARLNEGSLDDPRVQVVHEDAFSWLRAGGHGYDVVIADLPDADSTETAKLYSVEFYGLAAAALRDGGRLLVQAGSPYFAPEAFWSVEASLRKAGLSTQPFHVDVPSFGNWGYVLAGRDRPRLSLDESAPSLRYLDEAVLRASSTFPPDRDRASVDVAPSTLQRPLILDYQRKGWLSY